MRAAITPATIHTGDVLGRLVEIARGLQLDPVRMGQNLDLTGGMILSEAIMLELGRRMGRQVAHDLVYDAVEKVRDGTASFAAALAEDPKIRAELDDAAIGRMLDPTAYTGLCAEMAREHARRARQIAGDIKGPEAGKE